MAGVTQTQDQIVGEAGERPDQMAHAGIGMPGTGPGDEPEGIAPERGAAPYASDTDTMPPAHTGQNAAGSFAPNRPINDVPEMAGTPRSPEPSPVDAGPALSEVAPRATGSGFGPESYADTGSYAPGAVDTNRPADVEAQDPIGIPDPHLQPNVLQRQFAVDPGRPRHPDTAGEELVEADETEQELESRMPNATT